MDTFERNEHGHVVITITGLDLTGEQEIDRLTAFGLSIGRRVMSCLFSAEEDGYDKNHRLVAGLQYKIALVPTREIECDSDRTTDALLKLGIEKYGYERPLAGTVLRIGEVVSSKQMEEGGREIRYISALHDAIKDSDGVSQMLHAYTAEMFRACIANDERLWIGASRYAADRRWDAHGMTAFLVPAD